MSNSENTGEHRGASKSISNFKMKVFQRAAAIHPSGFLFERKCFEKAIRERHIYKTDIKFWPKLSVLIYEHSKSMFKISDYMKLVSWFPGCLGWTDFQLFLRELQQVKRYVFSQKHSFYASSTLIEMLKIWKASYRALLRFSSLLLVRLKILFFPKKLPLFRY